MPTSAIGVGGFDVLVVEDDQDVRDVLVEVLRDEGYRVGSAANGREALGVLEHEPKPRLILLDLMMPVMSGREFRAEQVRDPRLATLPVIVLTAVDAGFETEAVFAGCGFIKKPIDLDTLLAQVAKRL